MIRSPANERSGKDCASFRQLTRHQDRESGRRPPRAMSSASQEGRSMNGLPARTFLRLRPHAHVRESPEQVYGNPVFHIGRRPGILFAVVRVEGVRRRTSLVFDLTAPRVDARIALELARTPQTRGCAGRRRLRPLRIPQGDEMQGAWLRPGEPKIRQGFFCST
jgi:hypothetical protein